jgi:protoporphyrin/coproporphyrin ferrochelatase
MKAALLLAHGTPDSLDEMPEYLTRVRGGRPPSPELIEEMRANYAAIGGRSPLTDITRAQAEALARELGDGARVYFAMRNWKPFIADVLAAAASEGCTDVVAVPLAPQYSVLSVGKYRQAVEEARPAGLNVRFVASWHDHRGLVEAFAEKVREARALRPGAAFVFTAHSLPLRAVREGDPYPEQVAATAASVAARAGLPRFRLAWQSAGRTPEPWIGPAVEETLEELAREGVAEVVVAPIGFVSDHTEVLYDIDVAAADSALRRGMTLSRIASLNTSPTFIRALADVVRAAGG